MMIISLSSTSVTEVIKLNNHLYYFKPEKKALSKRRVKQDAADFDN